MVGERRRIVYLALGGNFAIAVCKFAAAAYSGSSAMASEGVHSLADTANELLLLYGLRRAEAPPTEAHPFGHGREAYFWSFIVALLIFALGASLSAYEGISRLIEPKKVEHLAINLGVLGASLVFESLSWFAALRRLRRSKGQASYFRAIVRSKDPTVFTVILEDSAALLGLLLAGLGITLAAVTGMPQFDAVASLLIAALLAATSFLLARETKALLIGEPAHGHIERDLLRIASDHAGVANANGVITAQLGPDHVLAALSAEFEDALTAPQIEACVGELERRFQDAHPEITAVFVKPQTRATWEHRRSHLAQE